MKLFLYILFIPIISISQNESIKSLFSSKDLKYSADLGIKYYSGNLFLDENKYSREGVTFNFNTFYKKNINNKSSLRYTASLVLSNAIAKKITIDENLEEIGILISTLKFQIFYHLILIFLLNLKKNFKGCFKFYN